MMTRISESLSKTHHPTSDGTGLRLHPGRIARMAGHLCAAMRVCCWIRLNLSNTSTGRAAPAALKRSGRWRFHARNCCQQRSLPPPAHRGVNVTYQQEGYPRGDYVWLIDFARENSEFTAVNQFVLENSVNKRPDIVLFVNGLLVVID